MAEGNIFKDNGHVTTIANGYFDSGNPLLVETLAYVYTPNYRTWATKLRFYNPWTVGGLLNQTIKMLLYVPGVSNLELTQTPIFSQDVLISTFGWNEITLPTPIALPVYSGSGPVQKFGIAYYSPSSYYTAAVKAAIPSTLTGIQSSEGDSGATGVPSKLGYFGYGSSFPPTGANGEFGFWNGMDIQITDIEPVTTHDTGFRIGDTNVTEFRSGDLPVNIFNLGSIPMGS